MTLLVVPKSIPIAYVAMCRLSDQASTTVECIYACHNKCGRLYCYREFHGKSRLQSTLLQRSGLKLIYRSGALKQDATTVYPAVYLMRKFRGTVTALQLQQGQ